MKMWCSVVIPVRNDAALLAGCLQALAVQSRHADEIIIVDNGSTDGLSAVLAAHHRLPLRLLRESRIGIPAAAATGYDAARGDVILRCDADSRPGPDWIERHLITLTGAGPEVVGVSGVPHFGYRWSWWGALAGAGYMLLYRGCAGFALGHHALWGSNMAVRRRWWRQVGGQVHRNARVHDDFDLSFRLALGQWVLVDRGSVVRVDWRALRSPRRWWRQGVWAVVTVRVNWRERPHWRRLGDRVGLGRRPGCRCGERAGPGKPKNTSENHEIRKSK